MSAYRSGNLGDSRFERLGWRGSGRRFADSVLRQYDAGTTLALPTGFDRSGSNSAASVLANGWEVARS